MKACYSSQSVPIWWCIVDGFKNLKQVQSPLNSTFCDYSTRVTERRRETSWENEMRNIQRNKVTGASVEFLHLVLMHLVIKAEPESVYHSRHYPDEKLSLVEKDNYRGFSHGVPESHDAGWMSVFQIWCTWHKPCSMKSDIRDSWARTTCCSACGWSFYILKILEKTASHRAMCSSVSVLNPDVLSEIITKTKKPKTLFTGRWT